jgi:hypothetical protein
MRMQDPEAGFSIPEDLDIDARHRARLEEIEEKESTLPTARPGSTYLAYKFSLHTLDGIPVLDDRGNPYLQWHTANTGTGYSKAPYIGSREIAEALIGRKLEPDEIRAHVDDWEDWLIGKTAMVDLTLNTDEKTGNQRLRIVRITPDRKSGAPSARSAGTNGAAITRPPEPTPIDPIPESREDKLARLRAQMEALEAVE